MHATTFLLPIEQEIDASLRTNLTSLREALFDLLAAIILIIIAVISFFHALTRVTFAALGLLLWAIALLITFLYWLRGWAVARSTSSLHHQGGSHGSTPTDICQ